MMPDYTPRYGGLFWKRLAEDAVSAFASGALSVLGLDAVNVMDADWKLALGVGLGSTVVMALKSLVGGKANDPSNTYVTKP